ASLGLAGDEDGSVQHIERKRASFNRNFIARYAIGPPGESSLDRRGRDFDLALFAWTRNFFSDDQKPGDLKPFVGPALEGNDPGKSVARQFLPKNRLLRRRLQFRRSRLPRRGTGGIGRDLIRSGRRRLEGARKHELRVRRGQESYKKHNRRKMS